MSMWWSNMSMLEHVYWFIAVPASLILLMQTLLTFVGLSHDSIDFHHDASSGHDIQPHFQLLSVRSLIAFFTMFGWTGIALAHTSTPELIIIVISFLVGATFAVIVAAFFYLMTKLVSSGNVNIQEAVGKTATVYLVIPAKMTGVGKVNVTLQNQVRELNAMTTAEGLPSGCQVKVERVDNNILIVSKL